MASKRKRDVDEEILSTPNSKIPKQEEVTRSGRVRKKPAKFADDVGDDLNLEATKSEPSKVVVVPPKPKVVPVQAAPQPPPPVQSPAPPVPPPVTKIVTIQEPVIHEEDLISMDKKLEEETQSAARRGRARKKSAKVLEMEEFEEAEKKQVNKKDASKKQKLPTSPMAGTKGLPKSPTSPVPTTVAKLLTSPTSNIKIKDIPASVKVGSFSPTNVSSSPVKPSSVSSSPKSPVVATAQLASPTAGKGSVIKLLLSSPAQSSNTLLSSSTVSPAAPEKSAKKKKAKEKSSPADDHLKLKQALEMPQQTNLSPVKQELSVGTGKVKSDVGEKLGIKLKLSQLQKDAGMIQITSTGVTPKATGKEAKAKKAKKSSIKDDTVFVPPPVPSPNVIHVGSSLGLEMKTDSDPVPKKKSKGKAEAEKQKAKEKLDMEESMMDHPEFGLDMGDMNLAEPGEDSFMDMEDEDSLIIPEEEIEMKPKSAKKKKVVKSKAASKMGQADFSDMPSDSDLVMDFSRMKSEDRKKKKAAAKEATEDTEKNASKKKRAPTAYMLWCNETRPKVVMENPGIDFSSISKTLGEMWSSLPEKEKLKYNTPCKLKRLCYNREDLKAAFRETLKGMSVYRAARVYNVPESTLRDRTRFNIDLDSKPGPSRILDEKEEKVMVDHINYMADIGYGYNCTEIRTIAFNLCKKLGKDVKSNGRLSAEWFQEFKVRHKDLKIAKPHNSLKVSEKNKMLKVGMDSYLKELKNILKENAFLDTPERVWIIGESAFSTEHSSLENSSDGLCALDRSTEVRSENAKTVAIIGGINAIGNHVPPYYVFPGNKWSTDLLFGCVAGSAGRVVEDGALDSSIYEDYVTKHLARFAFLEKDGPPSIVIYDGKKHNLSLTLREWAKERNVILFVLPPYSSPTTHPVDGNVFNEMKKYYHAECRVFMLKNPDDFIKIKDIAQLTAKPFRKAFSNENIYNTFKNSGFFPFDERIFSRLQTSPATNVSRVDVEMAFGQQYTPQSDEVSD